MPYILNKTNGTKLTVLEDASLDVSTDLTFVGRNYAGYGEIIDENLLRLLENFSNTTAPPKPILGQLWFDSTKDRRKLKVCYDGKNFKEVAYLRVQGTNPTGSVTGDLWWDTGNGQLKAFDGSQFKTVGPFASTQTTVQWVFGLEYDKNDPGLDATSAAPMLKAQLSTTTFAIVTPLKQSLSKLIPKDTSELSFSNNFKNGVRKGITLAGCNEAGSSRDSGYYFWGTAADALQCTTASLTWGVMVQPNTLPSPGYLTFVGDTAAGYKELYVNNDISYNFSTKVLSVTAASAKYADLAERYEVDDHYLPGTVLVLGGEKEVTKTSVRANTAVIGVVSKTPAYTMNSDAGTNETHPYIALKGRVFCKVYGPVSKGALLVTSAIPGHAEAWTDGDSPNAVFAKAITENTNLFGEIEVLVI